MKIIVCVSCEAEFRIKHTMDEGYYEISFCPFCGEDLEDDYEDDIEWGDDES